jgi:succinylglutamate desuccinylase
MTSTLDQLCPPSSDSQAITDVAQSSPGTVLDTLDLTNLPRELGRSVGRQPGPTLICLGGLHGNEPAGVLAIHRILRSLSSRAETLSGEFVGLVGNRQALASRRRFIDHDLNRAWNPERLARLLKSPGMGEAEDREQLELDATIQRILDEAPGRVFLLDLHTFSGPGSAFAILDDTLPNREMAMDFPVPLVLGLEEELSGTLASHLTAQGVTVLGFESGQHDDPDSVDGAESAIWLALDSCGLLEGESRRRAENARNFLKERSASSVGIVEVLYRHPIDSLNGFAVVPGFESFQSVVEGQLLGKGSDGAILAPRPAMLLMPLYQDQGEDGFFLVREIRPVWLPISATMRSWRLERYLHWLPGISRDPDRDDTFTVDRRVARFFALRLFHLLGFRREGKDGRVLVMTRRRDLRE